MDGADRSGTGGEAPDLSVVITTRNRYPELIACIESIAKSSYAEPFELVVIDDRSGDETGGLTAAEIEERFSISHVTFFHSPESLKMVRARNKGAELARGRLVLLVDDDNVVDPGMLSELVGCADRHADAGIVGPSMYMLHNREKYLDYQTINLFTMRTVLHVADGPAEAYESDGIPNVFLVKREVFEKAGYFDPDLVQSFTEPDFSYNAARHGFRTVVCPKAITYHDIDLSERGRHMGSIPAKAYCLIRNRFVIVRRYGRPHHLVVFLVFFSWVWPLAYSLIAVRDGNWRRIRYYLAGFVDGYYFALTGRFRSRPGITS